MGLARRSLVTLCLSFFFLSFFFSLTLFSRLIPWSIEALCINISLFLSSVFLSATFFPYLSLNHSPTPFLFWVPLDPVGAVPWQEIKLPTSNGSSKKQESSRKTSISALLTMPKPLTVWITINCGQF